MKKKKEKKQKKRRKKKLASHNYLVNLKPTQRRAQVM